jgi:hypothetical protein
MSAIATMLKATSTSISVNPFARRFMALVPGFVPSPKAEGHPSRHGSPKWVQSYF